MASQAVSQERGKRARSPSYPGIDLGEAIQRALQLYHAEGENAAPVETVLAHWGYRPNSGPGLVAIAALKKFGLLIDEGAGPDRKARLSDEALGILLDEREQSAVRLQAIQECALKPAIHAELWRKYNGRPPSDSTLKFELRRDRKFTDAGAAEFIRQFKSTIEYAKLTKDVKAPPREKQPDLGALGAATHPSTGVAAATPVGDRSAPGARLRRAIYLPISSVEWASLEASFPLSEEGWQQMMAVLEAMKPALVTRLEKTESKEGTD